MRVCTAHVYVVSEETDAYYELGFDNEMEPELAVKDSYQTFIHDFIAAKKKNELISSAFDANYGWDDESPYTLSDAIEDASLFDNSAEKAYKKFCKTVNNMNNVKYVIFAVDCDESRDDYSYWYDAIAFDFSKTCLYSINWRGTKVDQENSAYDKAPFNESTAVYLADMLEKDKADQIDVGDFLYPGGNKAGKVTVKEI